MRTVPRPEVKCASERDLPSTSFAAVVVAAGCWLLLLLPFIPSLAQGILYTHLAEAWSLCLGLPHVLGDSDGPSLLPATF